jgi:NAD(P)H dehydrogenase (quinone)
LPKIAEETAPRHTDLEFLMSVLVLVATGKFGRLLPPELVKAGLPAGDITATGRNQEVLAALAAQGFRTAQVDLSDAGQVAGAVAGQDKVVLISGNEPTRLQQHLGVIEAAKAAGVHHFYYTSGTRVEDLTYALGADHRATENAIKESGLTYTILRNGWYIENYLPTMAVAAQTGVLTAAVGEAPVVAPVTRLDLAQALAAVVTTEGHEDRTYSLTAERDYTYGDIAAAMSEVLGTPVKYQPVGVEQYRDMLAGSGLDAGTAGFLAALDQSISTGVLTSTGDDLSRLIGRLPTPLAEGLRQTA